MTTVPNKHISVQEYLAIERSSDARSEFFNGEMFAMSGASRRHNLISINVSSQLHSQLLEGNCEVYQSDMRVKVSATGLYTYPDVVVACNKPEFDDEQLDTLLNPTVLVEVLSNSTEAYDRGTKSEHYRQLDSLSEYVLVAQDRPHVERYARQSDGQWLLTETSAMDGRLTLESIHCEIPISQVYLKVAFSVDESANAQRRVDT